MPKSPFIHPDREKPRFKPFKAMKHMRALIADKEDTEQVFHIIEALGGRALLKDLESFAETPKGKQRLAERRSLAPIFDEMRPDLRTYRLGTVGRTYADFMDREGLTAMGLVEESEKFRRHHAQFDDTINWYANRLRDTHDFFHVLSGYGRDALGEDALLAFSYSQNKGPGLMFISYMGARQIRKEAPKAARVMDVMREGKRNGAAAAKLAQQDFLSLLDRPIDEVRGELNIAEPVLYKQALQVFRDSGLQPEFVAA